MKFIVLALILSLPLGYLFGEEEYSRLARIQEISKAPGFSPAVFEELIQTKSKKHTSFRVRYRYEVNGQQYQVTTTPTDQQGALAYVAQKDMQVAYSTQNPSVGMVKRYYDLRNPEDTIVRSLTVTSVLALGLSLPIALGIAWRLGWLRRSKKR
ncbi:DUF3592 domain-containing protein [Rhodoferax sp. TS-BS-61-7]|uniref:DUF3592 domain-containing protein n=1 Tax=Rhodoferax sp. TS-BS-61-7 TaxID=2094194 RepID=UPI000CF66EB7|nr:DUF3592 domain-containing protein [Rhodoferax sp. TS-BS-61-7]PQA75666.1 hypothetical protein C5F53_19955 [Rhodoferax sp. TS-BS-61-7]